MDVAAQASSGAYQRCDANGDLIAPPLTIMRVLRRDGVSNVPAYEGAAINRIITPPPTAIR